jgi:hypothetical protein
MAGKNEPGGLCWLIPLSLFFPCFLQLIDSIELNTYLIDNKRLKVKSVYMAVCPGYLTLFFVARSHQE